PLGPLDGAGPGHHAGGRLRPHRADLRQYLGARDDGARDRQPHGGRRRQPVPPRSVLSSGRRHGAGGRPHLRDRPGGAHRPPHPRRARRRPRAPARAPLQGHRLGLARRGGRAAGVGRRGRLPAQRQARAALTPPARAGHLRRGSMGTRTIVALLMIAALGATGAEATHSKDYGKKHKIFYHLNEAGNAKAIAVLTNIQNHVDTVGWENIEALELVVHGPALKTFLAKDLEPEVKGKLEKLMAGGLKIDACQITLKRQKIDVRELLEGLTAVPSGVARVMELQELGYAYVRP